MLLMCLSQRQCLTEVVFSTLLLVSAAFSVHCWVHLPVFSGFLPFVWRRLEGGSCKAGTEVVAAAEAGTASTKPVSASLAVYVAAVVRIGSEWPCGVVMGYSANVEARGGVDVRGRVGERAFVEI